MAAMLVKEAMKNKDSVSLESLRAIKSSILIFNTKKGGSGDLSKNDEIQILSKLVKQRKESADIYLSQNRPVSYTHLTLPTICSV